MSDNASGAVTGHPYTIVVGVSGTSKSPTALLWARAQAQAFGGRVIAVRAWRTPQPQVTPTGTAKGLSDITENVERDARAQLERDVADVLGDDHDVEVRLVRGGKKRVLLDASRDADVLVVDAPRRLTAGPMFAHRLVYAARCPVVVMPPRISGQPPSFVERAARAVGRSALASAGTAGRPGGGYRA